MYAATAERQTKRTKPRRTDADRVVLHGIGWTSYLAIRDALPEKPVRLTYDGGDLEIMTISFKHERFKGFFGLIVFTLARFFRKKIGVCGSFTHQREDLAKGMEPDQCFYLTHLPAVRGKKRIDLTRHPPPDLAVEIDITHSSLDRMAIYAAFKVPEVWRFDGRTIDVYILVGEGYELRDQSTVFPDVPIAELTRFLDLGLKEDDVTMIEALEEWLEGLSVKSKSSPRRK